MSSRCSARTRSVCQSCLLVRVATVCSNEGEVAAKSGEVGLEEMGVAAVEDDIEADMGDVSAQLQPI